MHFVRAKTPARPVHALTTSHHCLPPRPSSIPPSQPAHSRRASWAFPVPLPNSAQLNSPTICRFNLFHSHATDFPPEWAETGVSGPPGGRCEGLMEGLGGGGGAGDQGHPGGNKGGEREKGVRVAARRGQQTD